MTICHGYMTVIAIVTMYCKCTVYLIAFLCEKWLLSAFGGVPGKILRGRLPIGCSRQWFCKKQYIAFFTWYTYLFSVCLYRRIKFY